MKKEVFKDILNYEGMYQVSNLGKIKSLKGKKEKFLKPSNTTHGYLKVNLNKNGIQKTFKLHRLIAEHFIKKIDGKEIINHIDGNKRNNNISNLEWCTHSENIKHAYKTGLKKPKSGNQYTENNKIWKLTKNDKDFIIKNKNNFTQKELAKKFNVSQSTISITQKIEPKRLG